MEVVFLISILLAFACGLFIGWLSQLRLISILWPSQLRRSSDPSGPSELELDLKSMLMEQIFTTPTGHKFHIEDSGCVRPKSDTWDRCQNCVTVKNLIKLAYKRQ